MLKIHIQKTMKRITMSARWNCNWWTSTLPAGFGDQDWKPKVNVFSYIPESSYGHDLRYHRYPLSPDPGSGSKGSWCRAWWPLGVLRVLPCGVGTPMFCFFLFRPLELWLPTKLTGHFQGFEIPETYNEFDLLLGQCRTFACKTYFCLVTSPLLCHFPMFCWFKHFAL